MLAIEAARRLSCPSCFKLTNEKKKILQKNTILHSYHIGAVDTRTVTTVLLETEAVAIHL